MIAESKYKTFYCKSKHIGFFCSGGIGLSFLPLCFILVLCLQTGYTQIHTFPSKVAEPGQTFVPVPVVYFTPETNWVFGARASYTFHLDSLHRRPSTIQLRGLYTLRKQFISNLSFHIYRPEKRWELEGELGYYDFVYKYWGIGNQSTDLRKESYSVQYPHLGISPTLVVSKYWRLGLTGDFNYYWDLRLEEEGELQRLQTTGVEGGFVNGVGFRIQYDGRDHTLFPISGFYASGKSILYHSLWGSDYAFSASELDFRYFRNIAGGIIWASQALFSFRSGPAIPYYHLSLLGGASMMRGHFEGRYRNHNMWAIQSELRFPVWRKFFVVPFVSVGDVFDFEDYRRDFKFAGGAGLRYIVDHQNRVTVRADVAYGHNFQFYLSILEAF